MNNFEDITFGFGKSSFIIFWYCITWEGNLWIEKIIDRLVDWLWTRLLGLSREKCCTYSLFNLSCPINTQMFLGVFHIHYDVVPCWTSWPPITDSKIVISSLVTCSDRVSSQDNLRYPTATQTQGVVQCRELVVSLLQHNYYSLFCGVQELIFAAAAVTDSDTRVCPEPADGIDIASLQLGDMHCVNVLQPLSKYLKDERDKTH